jgi:hypothetical protein
MMHELFPVLGRQRSQKGHAFRGRYQYDRTSLGEDDIFI